jgi:ATP-dependent protease HslVU (ClpYQ) peptidase subunit
MTTIAYKDGILATDSRVTRGDMIVQGSAQKLWRGDDGSLIAISGQMTEASELLRWLIRPSGERPPISEKITVIVVRPSRSVEIWEENGMYTPSMRFGAWGSGAPTALGAMHAGASAQEAVEIASKIDVWTGGDVQSMAIAEIAAPLKVVGA